MTEQPKIHIKVARCDEPAPTKQDYSNFTYSAALPFTGQDNIEYRQSRLKASPYKDMDMESFHEHCINNIDQHNRQDLKSMSQIMDRRTTIIVVSLSDHPDASHLFTYYNRRPNALQIDQDFIQDLGKFQDEIARNMKESFKDDATIEQNDRPHSYEDVAKAVLAHLFNEGALDSSLDSHKAFLPIEKKQIEGLTKKESDYALSFIETRGFKKDVLLDRDSTILTARQQTSDEVSKNILEAYNLRPDLKEDDVIDKNYIQAIRNLQKALYNRFLDNDNIDDILFPDAYVTSQRTAMKDSITAVDHILTQGDQLKDFLNADIALNSDSKTNNPASKCDQLILSKVGEYLMDCKIPGFDDNKNHIVNQVINKPTSRIIAKDCYVLGNPSNQVEH